MIEMNVLDDKQVWTQWWRNFYAFYRLQGVNMEDSDEITRVLKEWGAVDLDPESALFYFENEQDQLFFMLRWS